MITKETLSVIAQAIRLYGTSQELEMFYKFLFTIIDQPLVYEGTIPALEPENEKK